MTTLRFLHIWVLSIGYLCSRAQCVWGFPNQGKLADVILEHFLRTTIVKTKFKHKMNGMSMKESKNSRKEFVDSILGGDSVN